MPRKTIVRLGLVAAVLFAIPVASQAQGVMYVTNGKVGIGTATPSELLHLVGDGGDELKMRLEQSAPNAWAYSVVNSNPARPNAFRISLQGSGGAEVDLIARNDPSGEPTMQVSGSIQATNVTFSSARALKTGFQAVDTADLLTKVANLDISSWEYKEGSRGRHIGPMAEEFEETFGLGTPGKTISMVDANGIAFAAIKALYEEIQVRDETIQDLAAQLESLQEQVKALSDR